jgi:hypothetical protein
VLDGVDSADNLFSSSQVPGRTGISVSGGQDFNGDGFDDVVVGAQGINANGNFTAGQSYVVYGGDYLSLGGTVNNPTATGNNQKLVANAGDNNLSSASFTGVVQFAGAGNDNLTINGSELRVDGGGGFDTLKLFSSGQALNLTSFTTGKLTGIERIDLTGTGSNALTLDVHDVLDLSPGHKLFIRGDAGGAGVGDAVTSTGWTAAPALNQTDGTDSLVYHAYTHAGSVAVLLIDPNITNLSGFS